MNEAETIDAHILPALKAAGWGADGCRIEGHGKRGKALKADIVLEYRNTKLAVVEAKAEDAELTEGGKTTRASWPFAGPTPPTATASTK